MTLTDIDRIGVESYRNHRRIGILIVAAVSTTVVAVAGLLMTAWYLVHSDTGHGAAASRTTPALGVQGGGSGSNRALQSPDLTLPQPTGYVGGVPVGFPETELGAVAAAYGYSRIGTGLDVQSTLQTVSAFADPDTDWFQRSRSQMADALVAQRTELGLAASGPDTGAVLNVSPSGYRIESPLAAGRTTVLTLDVISGQSASGAVTSGQVVLRWGLRWDATRWVVTGLFADARDDRLAAVPFTSDAVAKGWQEASGG